MSILSLIGIQDAVAQATTTTAAAGHPQEASILSMLPMIVVFIAIFYFLLIRPQSKRAKEHRNLIENLAKGDEVVTTAGLMGKISKITDDFIILEVADNIELTFQKAAVATILPKGSLKSADTK